MPMDNAIALGIQPLKIDIATPLMQAAKIRQENVETQAKDIQLRRDAIGAEARGLAPLLGTPEFNAAHSAARDRLMQQGVLNTPQAVNGFDTELRSPLGIQSIIARTQSPELAFREKQLAETTRQHGETIGIEREKLGKPVVVSSGSELVNPSSGEVVHKSDSGMTPTAVELVARQLINGDASGLTNIGKGGQGDQKLTLIRNRAAEILTQEQGMSVADAAKHLGAQLQAFKASGAGQTKEATTTASREANLNLILKATEAAIPAALEASDRVERIGGSFVPLNKVIQGGQVMTSNPELRRFGMANLQLAEHWARAMNPTGVMRESDRDMALKFLSTADSKDTYRQVVDQLKTQITRERDAVRGSHAAPAAGAPAAGGGAAAPAAAAPNTPRKTSTGVTYTIEP